MEKTGNIRMKLEGKVALITGAGSGIGRQATARLFAENGALVIVNDIAQENGEQTVEEIRAQVETHHFFMPMLRVRKKVKALTEYAIKNLNKLIFYLIMWG